MDTAGTLRAQTSSGGMNTVIGTFSCHLVAIAVLLAVLVAPVQSGALNSGDVIPFFKAEDLQGRPVNLGEIIAKRRVAVFFWDSRRATTARAMQALDRLQAKYARQGLEVVAVEGEGTAVEQVLELVDKLRSIGNAQRYTIVPDPGGHIARQFAVEKTPQVFLVDASGRIFEHFADFRTREEEVLERRVRDLLEIDVQIAPVVPEEDESFETDRLAEPEQPAAFLKDTVPEKLEKYRYFGSYYLSRKEPAKAEEYFRKYVTLAPGDISGWLRVGEACALQKRYDQAREAWETVLRIDPGNAEADASIRRLIRGEY